VSEISNERILQLLVEASQFNASDLLVNIERGVAMELESPIVSSEFPMSGTIKTLIQQATKTQREQGVFPMSMAQGHVSWKVNDIVVHSPLWIVPVGINVNKVKDSVQINPDIEAGFVNPFVKIRLKKTFQLDCEDFASLAELTDFLEISGFDEVATSPTFLGNFHHHRFEIIRELEELSTLSLSNSLKVLLGDSAESVSKTLVLNKGLLFPADPDQLLAMHAFESENVVVQGPPGTGKSQVLSNLVAKLLLDHYSVLVVSEKRVALEVIQRKLNAYGLGHLCFISTSETISREVLSELKEAWLRLEMCTSTSASPLFLSEQYLHQLQLHLDLLNTENLVGGVDYTTFQSISKKYDLEHLPYVSDLPGMDEWIENKVLTEKLYHEKLTAALAMFQRTTLVDGNLGSFDQMASAWESELKRLNTSFSIMSWSDLQLAMKKAALCQQFEGETFQKHAPILSAGSKEQHRFLKLRKKFLQLLIVRESMAGELINWKLKPTLTEAERYLEMVKEKSFFGKHRFRTQWTKIATIPPQGAVDALTKWRQYLVNEASIAQIKIDFCEIGVFDVENEMELVHLQIQQFSAEALSEWMKIPRTERQRLAAENAALHNLYRELRMHIRWTDDLEIAKVFSEIKSCIPSLMVLQSELKNVPESLLRNIGKYSAFEDFEAAVCKSNYTRLTSQFPQFVNFSQEKILEKCATIIAEQDLEARQFAKLIEQKQYEVFMRYQRILQTASAKLSSGDKALKAQLKKGKAILVKEFGKTRNYPSMRELFASDARVWIQLLKPLWLSNPAQVAKCFPLEPGLFDAAIFDEASQIPLQNALGTLQRSRRILVAGDEQQMGPSSYFKAQSDETIDLLHQASFHWKNYVLRHHYRSEHPELIRFSNRNFYKNELLAFPSAEAQHSPIRWHYCPNGTFDERQNKIEALEVANLLEAAVFEDHNLGVVAFSETQLAAINATLSASCAAALDRRIMEGTAFFKALENVQGEECDRLIISLGYGRNTEGEFHMRFGPLNSKNGAKRLNVSVSYTHLRAHETG
jgi:hypothetical protein